MLQPGRRRRCPAAAARSDRLPPCAGQQLELVAPSDFGVFATVYSCTACHYSERPIYCLHDRLDACGICKFDHMALHHDHAPEAHHLFGATVWPLEFPTCASVEIAAGRFKNIDDLANARHLRRAAAGSQETNPALRLHEVIEPVADMVSLQERAAAGCSEEQFGSAVGSSIELADRTFLSGGSLLTVVAGFLDPGLPAIRPGSAEQCHNCSEYRSNQPNDGNCHRATPYLLAPQPCRSQYMRSKCHSRASRLRPKARKTS
jgi:hypothetical protein